MTKLFPSRLHILQVLSIPVLFVQYIFSFVLAAGLRARLKKDQKQEKELSPKGREIEHDPAVMKIVEEEEERDHPVSFHS